MSSLLVVDLFSRICHEEMPKSVQASYFSRIKKAHFSESILCHYDMFDQTTFGLDVCIVHVVIFIKKYLVNMFKISFNDFLKILILVILTMLKSYAWFLFSKLQVIKKQKTSQAAYWKKGQREVFGFLFSYLKKFTFEKKIKNTMFGFFTISIFLKRLFSR